MIFRIDFRNFVTMMAVAAVSSPSTVNAFNIPSKGSSVSPTPPTSTIEFTDGPLKAALVESNVGAGGELDDYNGNSQGDEPMMMWSSMMEMIQSKIEAAEDAASTDGKTLSEKAKEEIIAAAVAYKARHVLGQASQAAIEHANSAIVFTKNELENEKDLSKISKKILLAIQEKAETVTIQSPTLLAEEMKDNAMKMIESEEFKTLPKRSFHAFRQFMGSDEVKNVSSKAIKAIKDGLESDEMKALQHRASQSLKETIDTTPVTSKK